MFAAAHENLAEVLPKPMVELAVEISRGVGDFLTHDLVAAVKEVKDDELQAEFKAANDAAAENCTPTPNWLIKERLPKADGSLRVRRGKIPAHARRQRGARHPPAKILEMGLAELKREQAAFAAAAAIIEPEQTGHRGVQGHPARSSHGRRVDPRHAKRTWN